MLSLARSLGVLHSDLPPSCLAHAGKYSGRLLIVSTGWNVLADLAKYDLGGDRMAVKEVGMTLFPCGHWFSCHQDETVGWEAVRETMATQVLIDRTPPVMHGKQGGRWLPWPISGEWGFDSGQSAAIVGCLLGYDEIWLAGMPCDGGGHYYPWKTGVDDEPLDGRLSFWVKLRDKFFQGKVKSLSGNTRDILT